MELVTWVLLSIVAVVSCLLLRGKLLSRKQYSYPPGPKGLPLLGCPWYMFRDTHALFTDLAKIWGDCFSLNILGERMIVLNNPETVRDTYKKKGCVGRPPFPSFNEFMKNSTSLMIPNQQWSDQRKLIHKILNMYGAGVEATERLIHDELSHVVEWTDQHKDGPINLDDVIYPSVTNIITILLQGRRYDYNSRELKNIEVTDDTMNKGYSNVHRLLFVMFPFLQHVNFGPGRLAIRHRQSAEDFMSDIYENTKATYDPSLTRGMIDYLLHYQNEARQKGEVTWLEEKHVRGIVMEMMLGGSFTTRAALYSFFLISLHKPEVAKRIREEIDEVIGPNRQIKLQDRPNLPYTAATIFELLRYISHVPLGVPHVTTGDVEFENYVLPKGTTFLANTWAFHHDEKLWPEPWEFKPERFLDDDMKLLPPEHPNRKNLQPFGIGLRSCPGETFAKSRIFLFITTLLQRFDFLPDPTRPLQSCDPSNLNNGIVLYPKQYYVRVQSRD